MDPRDKVAHVTTREFSGALTFVWTFIMLAFGQTVFNESRSPIHANVIYFGISILMVINSAAASCAATSRARRLSSRFFWQRWL